MTNSTEEDESAELTLCHESNCLIYSFLLITVINSVFAEDKATEGNWHHECCSLCVHHQVSLWQHQSSLSDSHQSESSSGSSWRFLMFQRRFVSVRMKVWPVWWFNVVQFNRNFSMSRIMTNKSMITNETEQNLFNIFNNWNDGWCVQEQLYFTALSVVCRWC